MPEKGFTTYRYARPVPAFRPRWSRSREGCLVCRLRRKKCDEKRPACDGCQKQGLLCSWPSAPRDSEKEQDLQWRVKLKAGKPVCHYAPTSPINAMPSSRATTHLLATYQHGEMELSNHWHSQNSPAPAMRTTYLDNSVCSVLIKHYVHKTADLLTGRNARSNAFLYEVWPIAHSNELVMYAIFALSGVHMEHANFHPDVSKATYMYYGKVLKRLKLLLTEWVNGSRSDTLILFVVTTLMFMLEGLKGNADGSMAYHLRACREFALEMTTAGDSDSTSELTSFLVECYVYFALISQFDGHSSIEQNSLWNRKGSISSAIKLARRSRTFGSFFGCSFRLYELIPSVSALLHGNSPLSQESTSSCEDTLEELTNKVTSWSVSSEITTIYETSPYWTASESAAGIVVQNTLFILLSLFRLEQHLSRQAAQEAIQPLIDQNLALFDVLNDTPTLPVAVWPYLIMGSMLRDREQQQEFSAKFLGHHSQTAFASRMVQLLKCVWDDPDETAYGLTGLERAAMANQIYLCLA